MIIGKHYYIYPIIREFQSNILSKLLLLIESLALVIYNRMFMKNNII